MGSEEDVPQPGTQPSDLGRSGEKQLWVWRRRLQIQQTPEPDVSPLPVQVAVTLFLALIVGALFFDVKEDQSGIQNRYLPATYLF